jgi:hypothetical protein
MAISDIYTARNNNAGTNAPLASVSTLPLLSVLATAATLRAWVVGVRVELGVTAAVAGNSVLFQLARPALTTPSATTTAVSSHDFSAPAAIFNQATAWSVAPTLGTVLWEQELPQTTGSAWEEFPPLGYEWQIPAVITGSAGYGVHMFATASVNTSTAVYVDIVFSE